jgi:hypothetical protein
LTSFYSFSIAQQSPTIPNKAQITSSTKTDLFSKFKPPDDGLPEVLKTDLINIDELPEELAKNFLKKDAEKIIKKYFQDLEKLGPDFSFSKKDIENIISNYVSSIDTLENKTEMKKFYTAANFRGYILRHINFIGKKELTSKIKQLEVQNEKLIETSNLLQKKIESFETKDNEVNKKNKLFSLRIPNNIFEIISLISILLNLCGFFYIHYKTSH